MGVALYDALIAQGALRLKRGETELTEGGAELLDGFGIDVAALRKARRRMCRGCLDWSMRRDHRAGSVGAAIWTRTEDMGWARREPDSRVVRFTPQGKKKFQKAFGLS